MSSCSELTFSAFHKPIIGDDYGKQALERGSINDGPTTFFVVMDGKATWEGTATLFWRKDEATCLSRVRCGALPARNKGGLVFISTDVVVEKMESHGHPYTFHTTNELPSTLLNLYCAGVYELYS